MTPEAPPRRPVRSFVRREGRFTTAQRRAVDSLLPKYGVPEGDEPIDFTALFGRAAPVHLEIGFGNGEALAAMARLHPEINFLGIEVHRPGVGALLQRLEAEALSNVRVISADAVDVLSRRIPDQSLSALYLFFPDPWPKLRHHKRRLVQPGLVSLVRHKLQIGGLWHLATDWEDYARHMLVVLTDAEGFDNATGPGQFAARPESRPLTRFERRGQKLGHGVWDLVFRRVG
ncbi:MAG TPA: tRNA (guanosine(46)-N7)-methyltransferase TrmB [Gammaproteobacteria bacterium]|nr:tRNA (guanosine(46)-N7)-methyltransferase TrmB [Gammaproteobacteria bacterium]